VRSRRCDKEYVKQIALPGHSAKEGSRGKPGSRGLLQTFVVAALTLVPAVSLVPVAFVSHFFEPDIDTVAIVFMTGFFVSWSVFWCLMTLCYSRLFPERQRR
jgi:hypothetical protein